MTDSALATYVHALLQYRPELALALPYLQPPERDALSALACLEAQFLDAIYGIADDGVAATKLHWWVEEFEQSSAGHARHPLTRALFAHERATTIAPAVWTAPIQTGLAMREAPPAADFAAQIALREPFHAALAAIEIAFWFGRRLACERTTRARILGQLLAAVGRIDTAPMAAVAIAPMDLLARHAINRDDLAHDSPERQALVADQLDNLLRAWRNTVTLGGPLSLFGALAARADQRQLRRAMAARDAMAELQSARRRVGPGMAWFAWRAARRWHHQYPIEPIHDEI